MIIIVWPVHHRCGSLDVQVTSCSGNHDDLTQQRHDQHQPHGGQGVCTDMEGIGSYKATPPA